MSSLTRRFRRRADRVAFNPAVLREMIIEAQRITKSPSGGECTDCGEPIRFGDDSRMRLYEPTPEGVHVAHLVCRTCYGKQAAN